MVILRIEVKEYFLGKAKVINNGTKPITCLAAMA
jgi:hypothetical protein